MLRSDLPLCWSVNWALLCFQSMQSCSMSVCLFSYYCTRDTLCTSDSAAVGPPWTFLGPRMPFHPSGPN